MRRSAEDTAVCSGKLAADSSVSDVSDEEPLNGNVRKMDKI